MEERVAKAKARANVFLLMFLLSTFVDVSN